MLGGIVTVLVTIMSLLAAMAFRQRFRGATVLFYLTIASLIVPSILISLGLGVMFQVLGWPTNWFSLWLGGSFDLDAADRLFDYARHL